MRDRMRRGRKWDGAHGWRLSVVPEIADSLAASPKSVGRCQKKTYIDRQLLLRNVGTEPLRRNFQFAADSFR